MYIFTHPVINGIKDEIFLNDSFGSDLTFLLWQCCNLMKFPCSAIYGIPHAITTLPEVKYSVCTFLQKILLRKETQRLVISNLYLCILHVISNMSIFDYKEILDNEYIQTFIVKIIFSCFTVCRLCRKLFFATRFQSLSLIF